MFWCMVSGPAWVDRCNVSQIEEGDKGPYKSCSHHGAILAIFSRRNHFWPIPTKSLVKQVLPIMWTVKVIQMNLRIDQRSIRRYKKEESWRDMFWKEILAKKCCSPPAGSPPSLTQRDGAHLRRRCSSCSRSRSLLCNHQKILRGHFWALLCLFRPEPIFFP